MSLREREVELADLSKKSNKAAEYESQLMERDEKIELLNHEIKQNEQIDLNNRELQKIIEALEAQIIEKDARLLTLRDEMQQNEAFSIHSPQLEVVPDDLEQVQLADELAQANND